MNDFLALEVSGAGMRAQRMRIQVVSENLANQQTIGPNGPYQRKIAIFNAVPAKPFEGELGDAMGSLFKPDEAGGPQSVEVSEIRQDTASQPLKVYEPSNPMADAQGYVAYPNVNVMREMADLVEASRSYEANLAAAKTTQDMLTSALELIRR